MWVSAYAPQIDLAYDILLMESMKRRLSGQTDVARSVRFADVPQQKKQQVRTDASSRHFSFKNTGFIIKGLLVYFALH